VTAPHVVTLGETMGALSTTGATPLMRGDALTLSIAGSESNVAIGLSRLGTRATWIGCVGDDGVGRMIVRELRAEAVVTRTRVVADRSTGLLTKEREATDRWRVTYNRTESAGAAIGPGDVADLGDATHLHVTGITMAIGPSGLAAVRAAVAAARANGLTISLDVNHRSRLWGEEEARTALRSVLAQIDIVFASLDETHLLTDRRGSIEEVASDIAAAGPTEVVLTMGAGGSLTFGAGRSTVHPAESVDLVDPVGAGDGFVAGYLHARLGGSSMTAAAVLGNRVGAHIVAHPGDWESAPRAAQLTTTPGDNVAR